MTQTYQRWLFELPTALEEVFGATLWEHGCEGIEDPDTTPFDPEGGGLPQAPGTEPIQRVAYFSDPVPPVAEALDLAAWGARGVKLVLREVLPVRDWLAEYRARAQPLDVGCFRLDPREPEAVEEVVASGSSAEAPEGLGPGRYLLRLPARTAFGTGSHESTRLALLLLEGLAETGRLGGVRLLDVGTGSGVLAFAALRLGAGRVVAYDIDLPSVCMAETNRRLNPWPAAPTPAWFAGGPGALAPATRFDLLVINVLPERIATDLPELVKHLAPGGRLLSSGNLVDQRALLADRFGALGLRYESELIEGEWLAMVWVRAD